MTDVDVLLPHYMDLEGLASSLESVKAQTFAGEVRVVVVDDGSPMSVYDEVRQLVAGCGLDVALLRNENNRGRPYTRNRLVEAAEAPYLAWLDAGDTWYPEKLALQFEHLRVLELEGADVAGTWVTCDYDWRWTGQAAKLVEQVISGDQLRALLLGKQLRAYLWSLLCPTRTFKELGAFDEQLPRLQDLDVFVRFVAAGGRLDKPRLATARALCVYEKSDVGRNAAEIRACNERIFAKHAPLYRRYGADFVRETQVNAELLSARFARNNRDQRRFAYFMARAAMRDPLRALRVVASKIARGV